MRWKIRVLNIGSKKTNTIKRLEEYIEGIAAKIQFFFNDLGEKIEKKEINFEQRLSKTGDFLLKLQRDTLDYIRKKQ